jgi:5'-nucleotidase / UDP-sugar diphosphatase
VSRLFWFVIVNMIFGFSLAQAQSLPRISVLHTSDLHSHFTSRQSDRGLGGYARVKSKITQLRGLRANSLLLDSGDWSEGSIFFTLGSGVQSQKMLDKFGYDAVVLGNHDWLVGPTQMYDTFVSSGIQTPVLSANLNFDNLSPQVPLGNFIKPYIIKEVNGVKVGIFGLSTFQLLYDSYFEPVKIKDPVRPALSTVQYLRNVEKCQIVILVSHLGLPTDKIVANTVPGIDLILGGHDHILTKQAVMSGGVPIVHIGHWGQYLGDYQLELQTNGSTKLVSHIVHPIDTNIKEDAEIKAMVSDSMRLVEQEFNEPMFSDHVVTTEVDLNVSHNALSNDVMGRWIVDSIREAGGGEIGVDSPLFASSMIKRGQVNSSDIFDLTPHIYVANQHKAWTILNYEVKGYTLRALLSVFVKAKQAVNLSNVTMVVDLKATDPVKDIKVGGKGLNLLKSYRVSSNPGVYEIFKRLKSFGVAIGPQTATDTGLEVWRVVRENLVKRSPIRMGQLTLDPRVRSKAPDFLVGAEYLKFEESGNMIRVTFQVFNAGLTGAKIPETSVRVDRTPMDSLDNNWEVFIASNRSGKTELQPGESAEMYLEWPVAKSIQGLWFYPIEITVGTAPGEQILTNNSVVSHLELVTLVD